MREYSLSHILAMALADLMAIVWIPEILEFANIGSDTATVLSVFMLALIAYSLLLMTVDTMSRLTRSRSALKCIANVSDALPLPNQVPEETVVRRINRGLTRMRCFISNANNLDKRGYSYRYSAPISTGSRQYYLAMERSIWNRPFMSTDETILLTCGEVLTESLRVNKEVTLLRTESETDTLTGALTYRAFIGHLKSLQTENVHNLVAVVYFGVEHLRTVNEHYGRKIGNAVLRSVGMRLSQLLPGNATLSRVNGAEFAMIVTDVTSTSDVEELATRMRNLAVMPVYTEEGEGFRGRIEQHFVLECDRRLLRAPRRCERAHLRVGELQSARGRRHDVHARRAEWFGRLFQRFRRASPCDRRQYDFRALPADFRCEYETYHFAGYDCARA